MERLRARVKNGQLVVDGILPLPDGTVLDLVLDDEDDDLSPGERRRLHDAIVRAWASARKGKLREAQAVLRELRSGR